MNDMAPMRGAYDPLGGDRFLIKELFGQEMTSAGAPADAALGAFIGAIGVPLAGETVRELRENLRIHVAVATVAGCKRSGSRKQSAPAKALRERIRRGARLANDIADLWDEDCRAPMGYQLTSMLGDDGRRKVFLWLATAHKLFLDAAHVHQAISRPKRQAGRQPHPTWSHIIRGLDAAYIAAGGRRGDGRFRRALIAMNKALPRWARLPSDEPDAVAKRLRRLLPSDGRKSTKRATATR